MSKIIIAAIGLIALLSAPCFAQVPASSNMVGPDPRAQPELPKGGSETDPAVRQLIQFGNIDALKQRMEKGKGKSIAELLAEDKAAAVTLVGSLKLTCTVSNAMLVAVDETAHTKTYEVACQGGPGYFLVQSDPPAKPEGFTCFAADAARQADIAAHRPAGVGCGLPENPGVNEMAASILKSAGKVCAVKKVLWRGQSKTTDFLEVSCQDDTGFMVRSPLPGSQAPVRISTCIESGQAGLACQLTESDPLIIAAKKALREHNVACDADQVHVIGHETIKKRQVVEFFCPAQQPKGLVAFIPQDGSTAPFEVLDCPHATKRQAICTLTKLN